MASEMQKRIGVGVLVVVALGAAAWSAYNALTGERADADDMHTMMIRQSSNEQLLATKTQLEASMLPSPEGDEVLPEIKATFQRKLDEVDDEIERRRKAGQWDDTLKPPTPEELEAMRPGGER